MSQGGELKGGKGIALVILNEHMDETIKIIKSSKNSDVLLIELVKQ